MVKDTRPAALENAWGKQTAAHCPTPPVLLNEREAAGVLGVSPRKFHQLRSEPWMPQAVELGERSLRWNRDELMHAIVARAPRRTIKAEPAHFQQARAKRKGATQ